MTELQGWIIIILLVLNLINSSSYTIYKYK